MIKLRHINKSYRNGDHAVPVLHDIDLDISRGEFVAIMGASGSGKTTLLNIIGCLDVADEGSYQLTGKNPVEDIQQATANHLARIRRENIGFVFQSFNLIPRLSAYRNVELPMIYTGTPPALRKQRVMAALQKVTLEHRAEHTPAQLSGGQQQRIAIARALVNQPDMLVADEPTGSLDSTTGADIMALFQTLNDEGTTILMVTHEEEIAAYASRKIIMRDGRILSTGEQHATD